MDSFDDLTLTNITLQVTNGWNRLKEQLPVAAWRIMMAALLAVFWFLVLKLGRRVLRRRIEKNRRQHPEKTNRQTETMQTLLTSLFNYILYFAIVLSLLSALGVDVSSLLTVAGIGGIAIGFGAQTLVKDVISGLFLWLEGRLNMGDVVTVGGQTGTVESIGLRTTVLRGTNGSVYTVPNGDIRTVVNMSQDFRRAQVDLIISHGQDWTAILRILRDEMEQLTKRLERSGEAPQVLGIIGMDRFAGTVRIEYQCKVDEVWALEREIRLAALERLRKEGFKP